MTPKEEAKILVDKFSIYCDGSIDKEVFKAYDLKHGKSNIRKRFSDIAKFAKFYHAKKCALFHLKNIREHLECIEYNHDVKNIPFDYYDELEKEIDLL
jgi:hypothetical protein